jgi:hypothetical protein
MLLLLSQMEKRLREASVTHASKLRAFQEVLGELSAAEEVTFSHTGGKLLYCEVPIPFC